MAKWQQTLNIKDVWSAEFPIPELAKVVSERLAGLSRIGDEYLDDMRLELADEFRYLSDDKDATTEEFNDIMRRLYDWAQNVLGENVLSREETMSNRFPMTTETHPSDSGADEHAPIFSRGLALMESAAAEREIGAMCEYERLQEERMNTMRASLLESLRIRETRIRGLRKALWAAATLAALETMGIVLWVVTR